MQMNSQKIQNNVGRSSSQTNNVSAGNMSAAHNSSARSFAGSLTEGQVIRGEITDLRNNVVTITLSDNTSITAQITDSSKLHIGQTTSFRVAEITTRAILLESLARSTETHINLAINKALEDADLPKTEKNIQLVHALLENRMPVNKPMLMRMVQQMASLNDISPEALVLMNKHNIETTPNMAMHFDNFCSGNNTLIDNINSISEEIPSLLGALAENAPAEAVTVFGAKLMQIITNHIENSEQPKLTATTVIIPEEQRNNFISYMNEILNNENIDTGNIADAFPRLEAAIADGTATSTDVLAFINTLKDIDFPEEALKNIETLSSKLQQATDYVNFNNHNIASILNKEEQTTLANHLASINADPSFVEEVNSGNVTTEQVLTTTLKSITSTTSYKAVSDFFSSDVFKLIFKEAIHNSWTLSPRDLQKAENINKYYEKLADELEQTTGLIKAHLSGADSDAISNHTTGLRDNVSLINQLNEIFPYVQLPIKFQDQTAHADLYVYTKKDELKRHPNKAKVLLRLDFEHLGTLEILVEKNNNTIDTTFYCPDDSCAKLFKTNINLLTDTLNEKGYIFNANVTKTSNKTNVANEFLNNTHQKTDTKETKESVSRYSFDIRA